MGGFAVYAHKDPTGVNKVFLGRETIRIV